MNILQKLFLLCLLVAVLFEEVVAKKSAKVAVKKS
jgi:hypothetical protein